jgi:hypothetical protein
MMKHIKKMKFLSILLIFILLPAGITYINAQKKSSFWIIGPSATKHFSTSYKNFNELHPGLGGEFQLFFNSWALGIHGYYMIKDSLNNDAFWTGLSAGYRIGPEKKFWCKPFVIVGGIKKREFHSGKFGLFALPVLSLGYRRFGFNIGYIPRIPEVTRPILIIQFKYRLLSFQL